MALKIVRAMTMMAMGMMTTMMVMRWSHHGVSWSSSLVGVTLADDNNDHGNHGRADSGENGRSQGYDDRDGGDSDDDGDGDEHVDGDNGGATDDVADDDGDDDDDGATTYG